MLEPLIPSAFGRGDFYFRAILEKPVEAFHSLNQRQISRGATGRMS